MIEHIVINLKEIKDLLKGLSGEQYKQEHPILTNASIGKHVRHILEFYQCLLKATHSKEVNYDARNRDLKLEIDIDFACVTTDEIIDALLDIKHDFTMNYVVDYSTIEDQQPALIPSTLYRELAYNLEHSIHHQALIRVAITEMQLTGLLKNSFGYAPSTIRHIKPCAQ